MVSPECPSRSKTAMEAELDPLELFSDPSRLCQRRDALVAGIRIGPRFPSLLRPPIPIETFRAEEPRSVPKKNLGNSQSPDP